jgi:hypothetical protein
MPATAVNVNTSTENEVSTNIDLDLLYHKNISVNKAREAPMAM